MAEGRFWRQACASALIQQENVPMHLIPLQVALIHLPTPCVDAACFLRRLNSPPAIRPGTGSTGRRGKIMSRLVLVHLAPSGVEERQRLAVMLDCGGSTSPMSAQETAETGYSLLAAPSRTLPRNDMPSGIHCSTVEPLNKEVVTDSLLAGPADVFNCTPSIEGGPHRVSNFRSFHRGGAFFLMADGSVHFIHDSIDMKVYRALSTIQGGDIAVLD